MKHLVRPLVAAATLIVGSMAGIAPTVAAGGSTTYVIGVDNAGPTGHNYEYVDYFPRAGVSVHRGDVLDFKWNTATPDGLHTATFVPVGVTPPGLVAPDFDDPPPAGFPVQLQFNPDVFTWPSCGSSPSDSCSYTGTALLNSGAHFNAAGGDFFVQLNVSPGPVTFLCLIHPGMHGSVNVVSDSTPASTASDVHAAAAAQLASDTLGARIAEAQAEARSITTNPDGTHTVTITAGTATPYVEVPEMLPPTVEVRPGDTVKWVTLTQKDPHTVSFPLGAGSDPVDPLPAFCEGVPNDTPAPLVFPAGLPTLGCASAGDAEAHLVPQPIPLPISGPVVISRPTTVATSGIITTTLPGVFPDHYSFSFSSQGTFAYQCRIHDHMTGVVMVVPSLTE
jgi:plastocyanin